MTTPKNTAPLAMTDEQIIEVAIKAGITSTSTNEGRVKFARAIMAHLAAAQPSQAQAGAGIADAGKPLTRCAAGRDGECNHPQCPQIRDDEPKKSGRHCPVDTETDDD